MHKLLVNSSEYDSEIVAIIVRRSDTGKYSSNSMSGSTARSDGGIYSCNSDINRYEFEQYLSQSN